jgi:hypothetical protein
MRLRFGVRDLFVLTAVVALACLSIFSPTAAGRQVTNCIVASALIIAIALVISRYPMVSKELLAFVSGVVVLSLYDERLILQLIANHVVIPERFVDAVFMVQTIEPLVGGVLCAYLVRLMVTIRREDAVRRPAASAVASSELEGDSPRME